MVLKKCERSEPPCTSAKRSSLENTRMRCRAALMEARYARVLKYHPARLVPRLAAPPIPGGEIARIETPIHPRFQPTRQTEFGQLCLPEGGECALLNDCRANRHVTEHRKPNHRRNTQHMSRHIAFNAFNLGDRLYRNYVSFIKDIAPQIGRAVRVTYSVKFF